MPELVKIKSNQINSSYVRRADHLGSCIPDYCFGVEQRMLFNFSLKIPKEDAFRLSG